jgi:hypothetical protein
MSILVRKMQGGPGRRYKNHYPPIGWDAISLNLPIVGTS